jgi:hypothetical protein
MSTAWCLTRQTFLPQVGARPDPEQFLDLLCDKLGLRPRRGRGRDTHQVHSLLSQSAAAPRQGRLYRALAAARVKHAGAGLQQ